MGMLGAIFSAGTLSQVLVGLGRTTILFIVSSGLSLILGVLRIPNVAHGSLYMVGAFLAYTVIQFLGGGGFAFWAAMILAPLFVAVIGFVLERGFFSYLYDREHLMLLLLTFSFMLILGDLARIVWGSEYRSITVPGFIQGCAEIFGLPIPYYNLFLLLVGPFIAVFLWLVVDRTKIGKIARAAAVDSEMVSAVGINVGWVFAFTFVLGCFLAGLGGALIAPMTSISLGMDHSLIMEAFLIVIMGGLGNIWGALLGSLIFGLTQSLGILVWPQFGIVFPYLAVVVVLTFRPKGLLRSAW
ncbi:MAG: branched-chain amino acid ABC transporter permease [Deltaproteobacteria bacterium]|nr:branched-chain amino acid ABC transporter permease [Deltaproteobacteria bacterium]